MGVARYVAQENIRRFLDELENGAEGARRDLLLRLLVEEENKVGLTYKQFDELQRQIERINKIISTQLETTTILRAAGHSVERAERSLTNAIHLLAAL